MLAPFHQEASQAIVRDSLRIAEYMVSQQYVRHPALAERYGVWPRQVTSGRQIPFSVCLGYMR